ncbi:nucleotide-sugar transporter-domain-containing protein [Exophiala viscosa]|uniref:DNA 3'-5' helicase n=1 Tax=Exophiala viscosa TaxID=2486360 RepID=A0AAN6DUF7_9EURO|nr:nucleotide-sugar transporter-domain-containing protein [Exophiala viscosa]
MGLDRMGGSPRILGASLRSICLSTLTVQFSAFILLLHYSRVMPTPDGHRYLPSTAVFLVEVLKLVVCLTIALYEISLSLPQSTTATVLLGALSNAIFGGDSWKIAIPACLWTLANSLQYVAISNLDAATFHVTYQFKILVTAVLSVLILRRSISARQWISLVFLMVGVVIVSWPHEASPALASSHHARIYVSRSTNPLREHFKLSGAGSRLAKRSATYEGIEEDELALDTPGMDASAGLLAVVGVCVASGLAGVYFEKVIKESPKATSMWIRNVQLSIYSLFPAFFVGIIFLDGETVAKYGFFAGYNSVVVASILVQTVGAVVAAFAIYYADNISKNFALSISMVLSSLASFVFFDYTLTAHFLLGASIVLASTFLYNAEASRVQRAPAIRIYSDEKSSLDTVADMHDMSIQIPKTPLSHEHTALATSRPGTMGLRLEKESTLDTLHVLGKQNAYDGCNNTQQAFHRFVLGHRLKYKTRECINSGMSFAPSSEDLCISPTCIPHLGLDDNTSFLLDNLLCYTACPSWQSTYCVMDPTKRILANFRSDSIAGSGTMPPIQRPELRSRTSYTAAERYFSQTLPQARSARTLLNQPFRDEADNDLDEFDRRLLAEGTQTYSFHPSQVSARTALSKPPQTPVMSNTDASATSSFGGRRNTLTLQPPTSSPGQPMTSPTTHVLGNRQKSKNNPPRGLNLLLEQPYTSHEQRSKVDHPEHRPLSTNMSGHPLPIVQGIQLVPSTALPDQLRSVFKFEIFNAVQSKCFAHAFKTDDNLVVSAPTGSGKTVIMELAICRIMGESRGTDFKVVYQAPTKSLCSERFADWQTKFGALNLQCAELTGDTEQKDLRNVQSANIIITTPEKWDSVTRKWKDHAKLIQLVKLFLVDEVHILKEWRGATLEAVVSRMKSVASSVRFVALSATVPNSEDIAAWLGRNSTSPHLPAIREVFGETFRPVELKKHVYGFEARGNDFVFDSTLTQRLPEIISQHGRGKPVMIFCSTRKSSIATAKALAETWSKSNPAHRLWKGPSRPVSLTCSELRVTSLAGVGFHHAGVDPVDRRAVEQAFLHGQINVICSTSTLAVGVNLPCYLVILKGTTAWTANGFQEYADLEVMQMLGRAGRPQFETSACAVILTRKEKVTRYQKMVTGEEVLESCLHQNLIEHLNAEIGLGTVYDLLTAKQWLGSTFLSVRLRQNPAHYQLKEVVDTPGDDDLLDQLCRKDVALLTEAGLVNKEPRLTLTEFGDAMARYYVNFDTMKSFVGLPPRAKMSEILTVLAGAKEFREVRLLASEKSFYREINKAPEIKFPIKVDIALQEHKILLLIQAKLGNVAIPDAENYRKHHQQHRLDKVTVFIHASRLIRCIIDCQIYRKDAVSVRNALELSRSLAAHVWDNTASQLRQVEGLGEVAVRKLASASINSIDTLINTEASRIELILGKNPPYGQTLLKKLESFPDLRVSIKETGRKLKSGHGATINVVAQVGFLNNTAPLVYNRRMIYVCFIAETSDGELVDFRRCNAKTLQRGEEFFLSVQLTKPTNHIKCYVMCDEVAGTCKYAELYLINIPSSVYPRQPDVQVTHKAVSLENGRNPPPVPSQNDEEFDDGGIDDQDLLFIDAKDSKIGVIEDIDDILDRGAETKHRKTSDGCARVRVQAKYEPDDDTDVSTYKEPMRLPNGRWTCQHDCNERNKSCKHKCCKEGVVRPKRRPKEEPKIRHGDKAQTKITSLSSTKQKSDSSTQEALQAGMADDLAEKRNHGIRRVRKASTSHPAAKRPKTSTAQDPMDLDPELSLEGAKSGAETRLPAREDEDPSLDNKKKFKKSTGNLDDPLFHFSDDSMDDCDCDKVPPGISTHAEGVGFDVPEPTDAKLCPIDDIPDGFLMSQVDFGGFEPPLEHVALSDVQMSGESLFITGNTSSPIKDHSHEEPALEAEEAFLETLVDFSECLTEEVETNGSITQTAAAMDSSETSPAVTTPEDSTWQDDSGPAGELVSSVSLDETEEERRKRLYEEDQKKKWEGIDQWLYDEFHDYVEII